MPTPAVAIEAAGLTKCFGDKTVVDSLDLQVPAGSVFAFLGRNGSGKTTTIRMLLGLLRPTAGCSAVLGEESLRLRPETRERIGYVAESHPLHHWMTVGQEEYFATGFHARWDRKLFDEIIGHFGLSRATRIDAMSPGQRAGVSLAIALAPRPELMILDDHAAGLDPVARVFMREKLREAAQDSGMSVLFSSHDLDDVEHVADHAAILDYSRLRISGRLDQVAASVRRYDVRFSSGTVPDDLPALPGLLAVKRIEDTLTLIVAGNSGVPMQQLMGESSIVRERPVPFADAVRAYMGSSEAEEGPAEEAVMATAGGVE